MKEFIQAHISAAVYSVLAAVAMWLLIKYSRRTRKREQQQEPIIDEHEKYLR